MRLEFLRRNSYQIKSLLITIQIDLESWRFILFCGRFIVWKVGFFLSHIKSVRMSISWQATRLFFLSSDSDDLNKDKLS